MMIKIGHVLLFYGYYSIIVYLIAFDDIITNTRKIIIKEPRFKVDRRRAERSPLYTLNKFG